MPLSNLALGSSFKDTKREFPLLSYKVVDSKVVGNGKEDSMQGENKKVKGKNRKHLFHLMTCSSLLEYVKPEQSYENGKVLVAL